MKDRKCGCKRVVYHLLDEIPCLLESNSCLFLGGILSCTYMKMYKQKSIGLFFHYFILFYFLSYEYIFKFYAKRTNSISYTFYLSDDLESFFQNKLKFNCNTWLKSFLTNHLDFEQHITKKEA